MTTFEHLGLSKALADVLAGLDYSQPTPIQQQAIPPLMRGKDILALAQTGTGKTAAFTLPILERLSHDKRPPLPGQPKALILAPTRELAQQIAESLRSYGRKLRLRHGIVVGGVAARPQIKALRDGVDVLVATTGRLLDHIEQGHVRLQNTGILVLDEADRMFDMGFIRDVRKIAAMMPAERQTALFSATMPDEIAKLSREILTEPVRVEIAAKTLTVDRVRQNVMFVEQGGKLGALKGLLSDAACERTIVFTRTKRGADRLARQLIKGDTTAEAIHGDKSQSARQRALARFSDGKAQVLVATDVAARGIDIDNVTHVINYDLPGEPESYVHRIGRTARAGLSGTAISLCTPADRGNLKAIEKLTRRRMDVIGGEATPGEAPSSSAPAAQDKPAAARRPRRRNRRPAPSRNAA
ncbi:DEAD/DEAH box helicase [Dichotomicrobium thermohalophilum]|uniref:DEAD-box ATP-dependent RNA helicase RhpA n=1 Tax=Dichotomicrobium thermohalophilum TaxID=933063 RepID=A0A397Q755_9HYPH|nr:DEAD/DEAH box helicase [Dichotomicrobium thermohalophilum]RIA56309.1 ATP-dependent RNA helicase RhlE [Dichotomicrobium thermohalophilum]